MDKKQKKPSLKIHWKLLTHPEAAQEYAMHVMAKKQVARPPKAKAKTSKPRLRRAERPITDRKHVRYYLGKEYPDVYVTRRELECLKIYAADHTIAQAARKLGICYRAGESLIVSLRKKTGCAKAADLLEHPGLIRLLKNKKPAVRLRENRPHKK